MKSRINEPLSVRILACVVEYVVSHEATYETGMVSDRRACWGDKGSVMISLCDLCNPRVNILHGAIFELGKGVGTSKKSKKEHGGVRRHHSD
jgi:hypothetical protein